jgi:hypothetical protein
MAILQQIERCMQVEVTRYPLTASRFTLIETMRLLHMLRTAIQCAHREPNRAVTVLDDRSVVGPQKYRGNRPRLAL